MHFNAEKTEEIISSTKRKTPNHQFNVCRGRCGNTDDHKHLGIILDEQLKFHGHIKEVISKAIRGIGLIHPSKFLSIYLLDQIYNLHVRPHLDYWDIVYHKYNPEMKLDFTRKLEQVQYSAALAVTGAWRGTSSRRLNEELGWECIYLRRWCRRMCHFFSLKNTATPAYLFDEIPVERNAQYSLRRDLECSQLIKLSALQVRIFKVFSLNGIYWIQISGTLTHLRSSRANY